MKKTAIIIIDYKSAKKTIDYTEKLLHLLTDEMIKIFIVDNSCDDNNYRLLTDGMIQFKFSSIFDTKINRVYKSDDEKVFCIQMKKNDGFAKGNNMGFLFAKFIWDVDFILFSNNDIILPEKFSLQKLFSPFEHDALVAVTGPRVKGIDGRIQSPCKYVNIYDRWWIRQLLFPLGTLFKKTRYRLWLTSDGRIPDCREGRVYRVIGAFMLCDANKFEEAGMFDEGTFLYAEEPILAERLAGKGYYMYYCPDTEIIHEESGIIGNAYEAKTKERYRLESELYYYRNYKNISFLVSYITKIIFELYYGKEKLVDSIKGMCNRKVRK